jgi:hypothetical protein
MMVNLSFDRVNLPFRTDFSVGGVRCRLSTNSYHVLQQSIPWQAASRNGNTGTFDMDVFEDASMDATAESITHFRGLRHLVFAMLEPRTFVSYDLLRRQVRGVVSSEAARDRIFWKSQLLPITIGILGTTMGVAPLHCACLTRNGDGLLVAGLSGAGKSTLTAALARRGFAVVSDDWTYISGNHGGLVADGLSAPIKLLPDSARFFPELRRRTPHKTMNGEMAFEIDPDKFHPDAALSSCSPKWIFFLERTATPGCRFVPCSSAYTKQFFKSNAERLPEELPEARERRSEIIDQLSESPSWILRSGDDPHQTAEAIEQFLPEVTRGTR